MGEEKHIKDQLIHDKDYSPLDEDAYKILFKELSSEPDFRLKDDFAQSVKITLVKQEKKRRVRFFLIILLGSIFMIGLGMGAIFYFYGLETLLAYEKFTAYAVVIGLSIVAVQYMDYLIFNRKKLAYAF